MHTHTYMHLYIYIGEGGPAVMCGFEIFRLIISSLYFIWKKYLFLGEREGYPKRIGTKNHNCKSNISNFLNFWVFCNIYKNLYFYFWPKVKKIFGGQRGVIKESRMKIGPKSLKI